MTTTIETPVPACHFCGSSKADELRPVTVAGREVWYCSDVAECWERRKAQKKEST